MLTYINNAALVLISVPYFYWNHYVTSVLHSLDNPCLYMKLPVSCLHNNTRCSSGVTVEKGLIVYTNDKALCSHAPLQFYMNIIISILVYSICCLSYEALCDMWYLLGFIVILSSEHWGTRVKNVYVVLVSLL